MGRRRQRQRPTETWEREKADLIKRCGDLEESTWRMLQSHRSEEDSMATFAKEADAMVDHLNKRMAEGEEEIRKARESLRAIQEKSEQEIDKLRKEVVERTQENVQLKNEIERIREKPSRLLSDSSTSPSQSVPFDFEESPIGDEQVVSTSKRARTMLALVAGTSPTVKKSSLSGASPRRQGNRVSFMLPPEERSLREPVDRPVTMKDLDVFKTGLLAELRAVLK